MMAVRFVIALALVLLGLSGLRAETFPSRQVELIVAYPAGGATDVLARGLAQRLSEVWGQPVVVTNRGGGATQIAANAVAQSAADGYKLLATGMETFAIIPFLYSKLSFDPVNDFVPVSSLGYSNQMLVVPAASPLHTIGDLLAEARKQNGALQYGTIGLGGSSHVNMVQLEGLTGVKLSPVHYRGGAPLLTDLIGNHVPMGFLSIALVAQYLNNGQLRALGVGSKARLPEFPDVPTIAESGAPGFEAVSWFGVFAPKATPTDVVRKINTDMQRIFAEPEYKKKFLVPNYFSVTPGGPEEFGAYVDGEAAKWSKVIKAAHLHVD